MILLYQLTVYNFMEFQINSIYWYAVDITTSIMKTKISPTYVIKQKHSKGSHSKELSFQMWKEGPLEEGTMFSGDGCGIEMMYAWKQ